MTGELAGKAAIVTGAAGGIGQAICHALSASGAVVAAVDLAAARPAGRPCGSSGQGIVSVPADVTDPGQVETMVRTVREHFGRVDILINAAGILRTAPILDYALDDWNAVMAVNATGVFLVTRAVARTMLSRGSGAIVTVASNAGSVPRAHMAAYCASKAASISLMKCFGLELARHGIRCNVVSPGSTDTPMLRAMWADGGDAAGTISGSPANFKLGIPLGKLATPADVARAVVFLASDAASHITMHNICVDGGATLGC